MTKELVPTDTSVRTVEAPVQARPRRGGGLARRQMWAGLGFVSPWLIGLGLFTLFPVVASLYYSFCDYSVLDRAHVVGFANYADLFRDELYLKSLGNTLFYAALSIPLGLVLALALALLLNSGVRGLTVYRTIFFLPALMPMVALAVLWLWIFNGEYGVLNVFLAKLHVPAPGWLTDPKWSKPALVLLSLWGTGQAMVIFLAGLQDVPVHLYEAADLDGATWWPKLRHVTLPMISPVLLFNGIMGIIGSLQFFAVPYIMAPNGQPARSAYFYAMYLYDNAFRYLRMGYASAMAWILFIIILALTLLSLRLAARYVHYEAG
jgi:multiple sugar transport system permease protein